MLSCIWKGPGGSSTAVSSSSSLREAADEVATRVVGGLAHMHPREGGGWALTPG